MSESVSPEASVLDETILQTAENGQTPQAPRALAALIGVFACVFGVLCTYALMLAVVYTAQMELIGSFVIVALVIVAFVVARAQRRKPGNHVDALLDRVPWWRVYVIVQALTIPAMLFVGYYFLGGTGKDYRLLFDIAMAHLDGESIPNLDIYGAYPNNHLLLMFMICLFNAIRAVVPGAGEQLLLWCHVVLNIVFIQASFILVACAVRKLWGKRRGALAGLLMIACAPFWSNCANPYSDTGALVFVSLALFLIARYFALGSTKAHARENAQPLSYEDKQRNSVLVRKTALAAGIGAVCVLGFEIKATVAIVLVAFLIAVFVTDAVRKALPAAVAALVAGMLVVGACNVFVEAVRPADLPYDAAVRNEQAFPYEHWVLMGMNPESKGLYSKNDFKFTYAAGDYNQKKQADLQRLSDRIQDMGPEGVAIQLLYTKPWSQWRSGAMLNESVLYRPAALEDDDVGQWASEREEAEGLYAYYFNYAQAYHLVMLTCAALCGFALFIKRERVTQAIWAMRKEHAHNYAGPRFAMVLTMMVALFGFGLFLCGIWEVKPRYLLHFIPLFCILEVSGLTAFTREEQVHR